MLISGTIPLNGQRIHNLSSLISLVVDMTVLVNIYLQPFRQSIHYRCAYSVESSRHLVSPAAELSAGVKHRKDHLNSRDTCLFLYIYRDSPSVVRDCDGIVCIDLNVNLAAEARQGLVHGIVHDLVYQMVKASYGGTTDIHSRALSYCLKSL